MEYYLCNFFIHSSFDGHLGGFHVLATGQKTVLQWTLDYVYSFSIMVSSGYMPSNGIVGSYDSLFLVFKESFILSKFDYVPLVPKIPLVPKVTF